MTPHPRLRLASAALLWSLASAAASAQVPAPEPKSAVSGPVNDQAAQDRIMALVRTGKCGAAKSEATRVGDLSLADQIGTMCGAKSSNPFPAKGGGSGGGGGRRGSGGRGG